VDPSFELGHLFACTSDEGRGKIRCNISESLAPERGRHDRKRARRPCAHLSILI
jgi:hypothetical protein